MFNDGDEMFHHLIRTQLILPYVKGDFYEAHLAEATGGKFFALKKSQLLLSLARLCGGY